MSIEYTNNDTKQDKKTLLSEVFEESLRQDSVMLGETAITYADVFRGWPWFEVSKGAGCAKFYGSDMPPGAPCPCGCGILNEAYPKEETTEYIRKELSKPLALGLNVSLNGEIKGFGWGYKLSGKEFADSKYSSAESQKMIGLIVGEDRVFFYISEVGVIPELQGNGIGTKITTRLANAGLSQKLPLLMRTTIDSPMVKIAMKLGMDAIVCPGKDFSDPENPKRVIFIKL